MLLSAKSQNYFNKENARSYSISKPTIPKDVLTTDDSHAGLIEKQSPSFHKRWQKRYFVLDKKILKYFKNKADFDSQKPPKGAINFSQIWITMSSKKDSKKIDLQIKGSNRVFNLKC